jgi:hypothetical protein
MRNLHRTGASPSPSKDSNTSMPRNTSESAVFHTKEALVHEEEKFRYPMSTMMSPILPLHPCPGVAHAGRAGLCDANGSVVTLRGANYIRLDPIDRYHSTFAPGANFTQYGLALDALRADGFNVARVFIDGRKTTGIAGRGGPNDPPLDAAYLDRLAAFVRMACDRSIFTLVTLERLPSSAYFANATRSIDARAFGPQNLPLSAAWVRAFSSYSGLFAEALAARLGTSSRASLLISLQNEFSLRGDEPPFSVPTRVAITAAGDFAMDNPSSRQRAADANVVLWAEGCRREIRSRLPTSLVTVGVFTFGAVGKPGPDGLDPKWCAGRTSDCRFPARPAVLSTSSLDFVDVHIYQPNGTAAALDANLATVEWHAVAVGKPVLMGEFGCLGGVRPGPSGAWFPSAAACVPHVVALQASSCVVGFAGWLFWTYDTDTLEEQPEWYSMTDDSRAIGTALAPRTRPSACDAHRGRDGSRSVPTLL